MGFTSVISDAAVKIISKLASTKAKLAIVRENNTDELLVHFNPSDYSLSRSCSFTAKETVKTDEPIFTFNGSDLQIFRVKLIFDDDEFETGMKVSPTAAFGFMASLFSAPKEEPEEKTQKLSIGEVIKKLESMTKLDGEKHTLPNVVFAWGSMTFYGFAQNVSTSITMFDSTGKPLRATANIVLQGLTYGSVDEKLDLQSPDRTKIRTVTDTASIWSMAQKEYDDPREWRRIADANGIMNPLDVPVGRELRIPPMKYK